MIESSRLFLFTEYAREGCGTIETHGTDYKVWEALPVGFVVFDSLDAVLTFPRIASPPTRELKTFSLVSKTTRSLRRRDLLHTTLVASRMAQTQAIQTVCTLKNLDTTCATTPRSMERMV
jgi:hypothetical protein